MSLKPVVTIIATAVAIMLSPVASVPACAEPLSPEVTAKVERRFRNMMNESGAPGVSVAIATENQLCYAKGFGLADVENGVAVKPETRFRTASIAKPMTAFVILSLVEEGAIDLDAEIPRYCPEYAQKKWPVTCRQLLGHLGGVRHYKNSAESRSTEHFFSVKSALSTFADDPLKHEPGTKYLYSSFGYNLLGSIAEGAGNDSFLELLQARVLAPAKMTHTVADDQFALIPGRTRGYARATESLLKQFPADHNLIEGHIYNAPLHDTSMKVPGGGLLSTATDLVRFAIAANTGKLLNDRLLQQMWTSQQTMDGKETGYGMGWGVATRSGWQMVSHSGGQAGTSTMLVLFPETGTSVAVMCNLQGVGLRNLAAEIAAAVQPPPPPTDYSDAIAKLDSAIRHEVQRKELPAFSISLVDNQRVVWADGFGHQDAAKQTRATAATVYRVGSVSVQVVHGHRCSSTR